VNWDDVLKEVEDYLFPKMELSQRERSLYYHVLLHTRFAGKDTGLFSLPPLSTALGIAERSVREGMRILQDKGCIRIEEISRRGHLIRAFLPSEIDGLLPVTEITEPIDLGTMTEEEPEPTPPPPVRSNPVASMPPPVAHSNINTLLAREAGHCFFCLRKLPQGASLGIHSQDKSAVVPCQDCATQKQGSTDENYLRQLYRKGFLSANELEERLQVLGNLQAAKVHS